MEFNITRFFCYIKMEFFERLASMATGLASLALVLFVLLFLGNFNSHPGQGNEFLLFLILHLGGAIFASRYFNKMHREESIHNWLLLPVSNLEKLLGALLIAVAGYPLIVISGFCLIVYAAKLLHVLLLGTEWMRPRVIVQPLQSIIAGSLFFQTLFLSGGAWFKNRQFFKTVASIGLFFLSLLIIFIAGVRIFASHIIKITQEGFQFAFSSQLNQIRIEDFIHPVFGYLFQTGLLLLFTFAIYYKIRKKEIKDAV